MIVCDHCGCITQTGHLKKKVNKDGKQRPVKMRSVIARLSIVAVNIVASIVCIVINCMVYRHHLNVVI